MKKINLKSKVTKLYEDHKAACLIAVGIICGVVGVAISVVSIFAIGIAIVGGAVGTSICVAIGGGVCIAISVASIVAADELYLSQILL